MAKKMVEFTIDDPHRGEDESNHWLIPEKGTEHSAAYDLKTRTAFHMRPGSQFLVPTGVFLNFSSTDLCAFVLPRSGLAAKHGITVCNSPGLIDPDYTGEVKVALVRHGDGNTMIFEKYDRIAQLMFVPIGQIRLVYNFSGFFDSSKEGTVHSSRGSGGFGSTGL